MIGIAEQLNPRVRRVSDKSQNDVYVGSVLLPHGDLRVRAYVKVFPPKNRGQLVYNEVIAHHVAVQCELPTAFTFPCACRPSLLRSATRATMIAGLDSDFVLGVASVDCALKELKQVQSASAMVVAEVMSWPHAAHFAVFDELLGNSDRHIDNLIRRGPRDYIPIDNEQILFGEPWFGLDLSSLEDRRCDPNILANTIAEGSDQLIRQRMLQVASRYLMMTLLTEPRGAQVLERRCSAPAGVTGRLINMLNVRRTKLPMLMQWHLRKGDLFQASMK